MKKKEEGKLTLCQKIRRIDKALELFIKVCTHVSTILYWGYLAKVYGVKIYNKLIKKQVDKEVNETKES